MKMLFIGPFETLRYLVRCICTYTQTIFCHTVSYISIQSLFLSILINLMSHTVDASIYASIESVLPLYIGYHSLFGTEQNAGVDSLLSFCLNDF